MALVSCRRRTSQIASPATQHEIARLGGSPAAPSAQVESELSSLPLAAQASISGVLGRDDRAYHASATAHGFRGENPAHGLTADFAGSGSTRGSRRAARLGLALRSIGYGDELRPVAAAAPTATKNRVEYRRGGLTEWYVNGPLGLEQGFTLAAPPALPRTSRSRCTLAVHALPDAARLAGAGRDRP